MCKSELTASAAAIAAAETAQSESELGAKWGLCSDIETQKVEIPEDWHYDDTSRVPPLGVETALGEKAIEAIKASYGDMLNTRYVTLVFHMKDVNPETSGGTIDFYDVIGTADDTSIIQVASQMAAKAFLEGIGAKDTENQDDDGPWALEV